MRSMGTMRQKLALAGLCVAVAVIAFQSGARATETTETSEHFQLVLRYVDPKPVGSYPASQATIQGWIDANDVRAIRAHGWDIWQSITAATPYNRPTWQTWYSGHELFEAGTGVTKVKARVPDRRGLLVFEAQRSRVHRPSMLMRAGDTMPPVIWPERTLAFNRFTRSTARYIWQHNLNKGKTLRDTLNAMVANNTPLASIGVLTSSDSTDSLSFVLKPVFQFIQGDQVTAVPYWHGYDTSAVELPPGNPVPSRWRYAVAVDPTGKHKAGDSLLMVVNNEAPRWLKVVPLSAFYYVKITPQDSAWLGDFGPVNGDFIGLANDTSAQAVYMAVRPGNYALLMAMHVTGKEIPNWTWQSFWWSYNPADSMGKDRPSTIPAPWNHYDMTASYRMIDTAFNPYLETSLGGLIGIGGFNTTDTLQWTGVTTNCMACHRRASIGWSAPSYNAALGAPYGPAMNVSAGDSTVFTQPPAPGQPRVTLLKTDFLW